MATPVLLILGAGPKIGLSVAKSFAAKGYKVAIAARSFEDGIGEEGYLRLHIDLTKTEEVPKVFSKVEETFGIPSVVVYNAAQRVIQDRTDPLTSVSIEQFTQQIAVNAGSVYCAAQEAVRGFKRLPSSASRTFIATGNKLNTVAMPQLLAFGMGKSAAAHLMQSASITYRPQGFKFYYADQRQPNGGSTVPVEGPAAGQAYVELAEKREQGPWAYTFVKDKGYVEFDEAASWAEVRGS